MLRGFRWQALALLFSVILFVAAFNSRQSTPTPDPTPETDPTTQVETLPTATPAPTVETPPTAAAVAQANIITNDTVPTYREGLVGDVIRLNPLLRGVNPNADDITSLIFEGLVRTNAYGEPEPALAREWVISNNRLEYVFRLREDVQWQDGTPFTARDVDYTMSILRSPDFPGDPHIGEFWRTVETEVLGDYLVRFRLTQPLGSFLDALRIGILPEHVLRGTQAANLLAHPFNLSPIGTGAYQLEAIRTDNGRIAKIDLRVAPVYRQRPEGQTGYAVERVQFVIFTDFDNALTALNNGDIDGLAAQTNPQRLALTNVPIGEVYTQLEPTLGTLIFNWRRPEGDDAPLNPFREQRVRTALITALNREAIVERNLTNRAVYADSPLMPGSWAYAGDIDMPVYDAQTAATLFETANLATEEGQPLLTFNILTPDIPELANIAQEIAAQWSQYNLSVTPEPVAPDVYRQRLESGEFDTAIVELSLGRSADPDVYSFWHQGQFPDGYNYGAVDDRRISETLERARRDPSGINRIEYYHQFQQEFSDRAIAIPMYYALYTYTVNKAVDGVQLGFIGEPSDRLRNIQDWTITR